MHVIFTHNSSKTHSMKHTPGKHTQSVIFLSTVRKFISEDRLPHLLFYGPPGTGKTSTILAVAKQLYSEKEFGSMVLEVFHLRWFYFACKVWLVGYWDFGCFTPDWCYTAHLQEVANTSIFRKLEWPGHHKCMVIEGLHLGKDFNLKRFAYRC